MVKKKISKNKRLKKMRNYGIPADEVSWFKTIFMYQSVSYETVRRSASPEIHWFILKPQPYYRDQKTPRSSLV
jgi:hypothetical protein